MSETMRAVDIENGAGPLSALHIAQVPKPTYGPSQALIRVKAFGLNRMDLLQREGKYPVPAGASKILGVEFSGVIEEVGKEAGEWKAGDEVFGLAYGGCYAEFVVVSVKMLVRKPAELSWEVAAGIPETWITATQALFLLPPFPISGKTILFHAGASSVSIAGIQLALHSAHAQPASAVYATCRQDSKCEFVTKNVGATAAFNTSTQDWVSEVLRATNGRGVDLIIDFIGGGPIFEQNLKAVARDGAIVNLGFLGGTKVGKETDVSAFLMKRLTYVGSSLRSRDEEYQGKLRDRLVEEVVPGIVGGKLKVFVEKVLPWEQVQEAQKLLEENKTMGKVICTIS